MSAPPYMKFYWGDYFGDTRRLRTPAEHGAYMLILGEMWRAGGSLPATDDELSRAAMCSPKEWSSLRPIIMPFFQVKRGRLTHKRVTEEMAKFEAVSKARKQAGKAGGNAKAGKEKEIPLANAKQKPSKSPHNQNHKDKEPPISPKGDADLFGKPLEEPPPLDPVQVAFDAWNDTARRWRLPVAVSLTAGRRKAISKRLAEAGPEGWAAALRAVEKSSLCVGQAPPRPGSTDPWRADLDFVTQAKSFNRLREGFYGNCAVPIEPVAKAVDPLDIWRFRVRNFQTDPGSWKRLDWGAPPGREPRSDEYPCKTPPQVLGEFNIQPWGA